MKWLSLHWIFTLTFVIFVICNEAGDFTSTTKNTEHKFVLDSQNSSSIKKEYQAIVFAQQCSKGWRADSTGPLNCSPICVPDCVNAQCTGPNTCECSPGHAFVPGNSTACYNICGFCVNSRCRSEAVCQCFDNYKRDELVPSMCHPVCSHSCENGTCVAQNVCRCFDGYAKHESEDNVCIPKCSKTCADGNCTASGVCSCNDGYMSHKFSPSSCVPICDPECTNGDCIAPNLCRCNDTYKLHPRDNFQCFFQAPYNKNLHFCKFVLSKAIKYDKNNNCLEIKEKAKLIGDIQCTLIEKLTHANHNQPISQLQCSTKKYNGTYKIHCNYIEEEFANDESSFDITTNEDWRNVILIINSYQDINDSETVKNVELREWSINTYKRVSGCGRVYFSITIDGRPVPSPEVRYNTTAKWWLSVVLIIAFMTLTTVGVGSFLWLRHRRLNDPLNYRENMEMRGYNNDVHDSRPREVVSDDDDDDKDEEHNTTYVAF